MRRLQETGAICDLAYDDGRYEISIKAEQKEQQGGFDIASVECECRLPLMAYGCKSFMAEGNMDNGGIAGYSRPAQATYVASARSK